MALQVRFSQNHTVFWHVKKRENSIFFAPPHFSNAGYDSEKARKIESSIEMAIIMMRERISAQPPAQLSGPQLNYGFGPQAQPR